MTTDGILRYQHATPSDQITLIESPISFPHPQIDPNNNNNSNNVHYYGNEKEMEEEDEAGSEIMTLEDFLVKARTVEEEEVKMPGGDVFGFSMLDRVEGEIVGLGNGVEVMASGGVGGGKRGRSAVAWLVEPLDEVVQQRQRRMIKNRESAARSRERKQAYQVELESQAVRLEEENKLLLKEKEEMTKERFKQLMEKVIPVVEKRRIPRALQRAHSLQW